MEGKELLPETLTDQEREEYELQARAIEKEMGKKKVHPIVFVHPETKERSVCFLEEPNYMFKIVTMDKAINVGQMVAAEDIRSAMTIKEKSDAITYSDAPGSDEYKFGVCMYIVQNIVSYYIDQYKKK